MLDELIQQSGTRVDAIESRLAWEPGRLSALLSEGVSFEALLDVLPTLDSTPGDFFAKLYGYGVQDAEAGGQPLRGGDRRFDESRRVVRAALARRSARKQEKLADRSPT